MVKQVDANGGQYFTDKYASRNPLKDQEPLFTNLFLVLSQFARNTEMQLILPDNTRIWQIRKLTDPSILGYGLTKV